MLACCRLHACSDSSGISFSNAVLDVHVCCQSPTVRPDSSLFVSCSWCAFFGLFNSFFFPLFNFNICLYCSFPLSVTTGFTRAPMPPHQSGRSAHPASSRPNQREAAKISLITSWRKIIKTKSPSRSRRRLPPSFTVTLLPPSFLSSFCRYPFEILSSSCPLPFSLHSPSFPRLFVQNHQRLRRRRARRPPRGRPPPAAGLEAPLRSDARIEKVLRLGMRRKALV